MAIGEMLQIFGKQPGRRKVYAIVPDSQVLDVGHAPDVIAPQGAYFEVRVAEMFLRHRSEYGRAFVPLTLVRSDFVYDGGRRVFPFFVGNELLGDLDRYVEGEHVVLRNTRVVGPVPFAGDDLGLFVGLYRVQVGDLAKRLLEMLGQVVSVFDLTTLSRYVDVAGKLKDGIDDLLDMKDLELRIGERDVFEDKGTKALRQGYLAYINCEEGSLRPADLWVRDNRLWTGASSKTLRPLREHDYCLVHIQSHTQRKDCTTLPFHRTWEQVRNRVESGQVDMAQVLLMDCRSQIARSPDLTPRQAENLLLFYERNFHTAVEDHNRCFGTVLKRTPTIYRSGKGVLSPKASIQKSFHFASKAGFEDRVLQGLAKLGQDWDRLPALDSRAELTDQALNEQLAALDRVTGATEPDPMALAEALSVAALTAD